MLAIQAPPLTALITPARRDSPRPAAMVRSASGPRPNTTLLPSGMPSTSPDGVVTRAAAELVGWDAIAGPCHRPSSREVPTTQGSGSRECRSGRHTGPAPESGDGAAGFEAVG